MVRRRRVLKIEFGLRGFLILGLLRNGMEKEECTSCGRNLNAADTFVEFSCPECGETVARCGRCKKLAREYECPECGFTGP